ncbi:MAG: ATP-binding protein [Pyrinomonadaceae bacterium]
MKLRTKILSYTLPLILIPFLLTAPAVYYFVIRANQIRIQEEKQQSLNETLVRVRQEIDVARKDVELLAKVPAVASYLQNLSTGGDKDGLDPANQETPARTALELFFEQNPYYLELSLVDRNGRERIKFSKIPNAQDLRRLSGEDYFRRTLISGSVQTPVREIQPGKFATLFTHRVDGDEFLGMIVLRLNTKVFERFMRPLLKRDLGTFLFDDRGLVFASAFFSEEEKILIGGLKLEKEASDLLESSVFEIGQRRISGGEKDFLFSVLPSESFFKYAGIQKQAGENWFLGVFQPGEGASIPAGFQAVFFSILILTVGAVWWGAVKASRYITIPLEKVSAATARIGRGEADLELDIRTGDEVEDLAGAVRRMNRELQSYQKQLVQTAKLAAMGEMTSEISHEIQNRISGISLWLQHLDSEIERDDPRREYLDEMKQGLSGFMEMLADLKQYYRRPVLDLKPLDLNRLAEETIPFAGELLERKKAVLKTDFERELPLISGDEEKLKSVILNLLLNAAESLTENGSVEIQTRSAPGEKGRTVLLRIADNGSGIAEEDLARIFYPFFSTKSGGSGLGLAISSNIVAAHQGRIEVSSELGKGTAFTISLMSWEPESGPEKTERAGDSEKEKVDRRGKTEIKSYGENFTS